jgi:predicted SnoaL-like aldol condensation-catalyzing enzyme
MNPLSAHNQALAQRFHEDIFKAGNLAVADEILAPDFIMHAPGFPAELTHGPEGMKRLAIATRTAFPDLQTTDEDTIAQGDKVVIRAESFVPTWALLQTIQVLVDDAACVPDSPQSGSPN